MKIGILGGTFNPPHIGHLILAEEALEKLNLERVFFIPAHIPPHKEANCIEASHRLKMVKLSIQDERRFLCLDMEIKRGGVSYTIDTLKELKNLYPYDEFFLIIGSDLAKDFSSWKDYNKIFDLAKVVVAKRGVWESNQNYNFIFLDIPYVDISSSLIRERIRKGLSIRYLVHPKVEAYIKRKRLYLK